MKKNNDIFVGILLIILSTTAAIAATVVLEEGKEQEAEAQLQQNCSETRGEKMNIFLMGYDGNKQYTVDLVKPYEHSLDLNTAHQSDAVTMDKYWTYLQQLCGMDGGQVQSLAEMKKYAPIIKNNGGSFIGYNIESEVTPIEEVNNPVNSMKKACDIAKQNGLKCLIGPSKALTTKYLSSILANAKPDIYVLQAQSLQENPTSYQNFAKPILQKIESYNPNIITLTQVSATRTNATVSQMMAAYDTIDDYSDGVNIWYGNSVKDKLAAFVQAFDTKY